MKNIARTFIVSAAALATVLVSMSTASADHRHWRHHDRGDAVALGVIGLAAGAIIGGAIADSRANQRVYIDPPRSHYRPAPRRYYPAAPAYRPVVTYSYEPWTAGWYRYCSDRYRSFNPDSGTFIGYDGREHFCVVN